MPKLKILAACEKTIFDINGPVSLISLFQRMNIQLQDEPLPEKAVSPSLWSIFSLWENDPKEVGQEFTQLLKVFVSDGTLWHENELTFKNDNVDDYQTKINIQMVGLPIWVEGLVEIKVWLKGDETELGSYRFSVDYLPKNDSATTDG